MLRSRRLIAWSLALVVLAAADAVRMRAETLFVGVPIYSVMKTETALLAVSPTAANAFTPTLVPCPSSAGALGCTVRVTVSAQFVENTTAVDVVQMNLGITGPGIIGPSVNGSDGLQSVAPNLNGSWPQAYTTLWVKRNVPAGSTPTVSLQFLTHAGVAIGSFRTVAIDVFSSLV